MATPVIETIVRGYDWVRLIWDVVEPAQTGWLWYQYAVDPTGSASYNFTFVLPTRVEKPDAWTFLNLTHDAVHTFGIRERYSGGLSFPPAVTGAVTVDGTNLVANQVCDFTFSWTIDTTVSSPLWHVLFLSSEITGWVGGLRQGNNYVHDSTGRTGEITRFEFPTASNQNRFRLFLARANEYDFSGKSLYFRLNGHTRTVVGELEFDDVSRTSNVEFTWSSDAADDTRYPGSGSFSNGGRIIIADSGELATFRSLFLEPLEGVTVKASRQRVRVLLDELNDVRRYEYRLNSGDWIVVPNSYGGTKQFDIHNLAAGDYDIDTRARFVDSSLQEYTASSQDSFTISDEPLPVRKPFFPKYRIAIDWDNNGTALYDTNSNFTPSTGNITEDVIDFNFQFGVQDYYDYLAHEGTMTITVDNADEKYSPDNTDSELHGYLKSDLGVHFQMWHEERQVWERIWSGWTHEFDVDVGDRSKKQARIKCRQGVYRFNKALMYFGLDKDLRLDEILVELIDNSDYISLVHAYNQKIWSVIDKGRFTYDYVGDGWSSETKLNQALKDVLMSEHGRLFIDGRGFLQFFNLNHFLDYGQGYTQIENPQAVTYKNSSDTINWVDIFFTFKEIEEDVVVWGTKDYIYVPPNGSSEPVILNFYFEEGLPKGVDVETLNTDDIVVKHWRWYPYRYPDAINATAVDNDDDTKVSVTFNETAERLVELIISNLTLQPLWVSVQDVKANQIQGGDRNTFTFKNQDSIDEHGTQRKVVT